MVHSSTSSIYGTKSRALQGNHLRNIESQETQETLQGLKESKSLPTVSTGSEEKYRYVGKGKMADYTSSFLMHLTYTTSVSSRHSMYGPSPRGPFDHVMKDGVLSISTSVDARSP